MILADFLNISIKLLLVVHVLVSFLLILVVLMQRPKQEGLGAAFGGGVADQVWGAQTTNVLQKGTVFLGTLFMLLSLGLAIMIGKRNDQAAIDDPPPAAVESVTALPGDLPEGVSVADQLEEAEGNAPEPVVPTTEEEAPAPDAPGPDAPEPDAPASGESAPDGDTPAAPDGDGEDNQ